MRRFSQRNSLVTLNDINITPLLDLAFVLLIIFVITTPLLEQGMDLTLPPGGKPDQQLTKEDIQTVEISPRGDIWLAGRPINLDALEQELVRIFRQNPNMVVFIRADQEAFTKYLYSVIERCQRNGIKRYSFRTSPPK